MLKNKILLLGFGFLGEEVCNEAVKRNCHVEKTRLHQSDGIIQLDINNHTKVKNLIESQKPEIVINCISRNDIDSMEKNPKLATDVNVKGPKIVAEICEKIDSRLIHISTDSVFDGKKGMYSEYDKPNPINIYARSKLDGENEIKNACKNFVIIRTNFFGINKFGNYLFNNILTKLKNNEKIQGFKDVVFTPISTENLAQQIMDVVFSDYRGILNLSANKLISKLEFCNILANKLNFKNFNIIEESIDNFNFIAKRPKNTSLDNSLSKSIVKHKSIDFEEWLDFSKTKIIQHFNLENNQK